MQEGFVITPNAAESRSSYTAYPPATSTTQKDVSDTRQTRVAAASSPRPSAPTPTQARASISGKEETTRSRSSEAADSGAVFMVVDLSSLRRTIAAAPCGSIIDKALSSLRSSSSVRVRHPPPRACAPANDRATVHPATCRPAGRPVARQLPGLRACTIPPSAWPIRCPPPASRTRARHSLD